MKDFSINRNSWHYRLNAGFLNSYTNDYWESKHGDFCSYWRSTFAKILLVSFILMLTIVLCFAVYKDPIGFLAAIFAIIMTVVTIASVSLLYDYITKKYNHKEDSLFIQKYKSHKLRICSRAVYIK